MTALGERPDGVYWGEWARIPAPARERLGEALAIAHELRGQTRAEHLWEAYAARGLIPESWVDDPGRRFDCNLCGVGRIFRSVPLRGSCRRCGSTGACPRPSRREVCAAFAADVPGVLAAEAVARAAGRFAGVVWSEDGWLGWRQVQPRTHVAEPQATDADLAAWGYAFDRHHPVAELAGARWVRLGMPWIPQADWRRRARSTGRARVIPAAPAAAPRARR